MLNDLADKILEKLPKEWRDSKAGVEKNIREAVHKVMAKLDLVSHEELKAQNQALARAEAQIKELEKRLVELEKSIKSE